MIISKILRKSERDVEIVFEDDEKLIVAYDVFMENGLRKGDDISEDHFSDLIEKNKKYFIKKNALRLLGRRLHTSRELKIKLRQKRYEEGLVDSVISELAEKKFINDDEFSKQFILEKAEAKKWGRGKIKSELIKRGIAAQKVEQVMAEVLDVQTDYANAHSLAQKKLKTFLEHETNQMKIKQKLFSFLKARGFEFDVINEVVNNLLKDEEPL